MEEPSREIPPNASQDKLSLGADEQPISQTTIPVKLDNEQLERREEVGEPVDMADLDYLNEKSDMGSRGAQR